MFSRQLLRFARVLTRDDALADDLVQETFMRALSYLPLLESMNLAQRRGWLYTVLRNFKYDLDRRKQVENLYQSIRTQLRRAIYLLREQVSSDLEKDSKHKE